jgi:GTP-binding protein HflX
LAIAVSDALSRAFADLEVETHVGNGKLLAYLAEHGEILSQRYQEDRVTVHCRIPQRFVGRIHSDGTAVRTRDGQPVERPVSEYRRPTAATTLDSHVEANELASATATAADADTDADADAASTAE